MSGYLTEPVLKTIPILEFVWRRWAWGFARLQIGFVRFRTIFNSVQSSSLQILALSRELRDAFKTLSFIGFQIL